MRLIVKLPLIVVGAMLLTEIAGGALAIYLGRQVLREDALADSAYRARIYASAVEFYVASARAVIGTTALEPELESAEGARRIAANILAESPMFEYVALLGGDGAVQMLEPRALEERLSHRNLFFSGWFAELLGRGEAVVSDLHISPATQRPTVIIAAPVRDAEGRVRAVWSGALKLHALSEIGGAVRGAGHAGASGYVTDRRGLILAHEAERRFVEQQTDFSAVPSVRAALEGRNGAEEVFNPIEGAWTLSAYRPLPGLGWAIVHRVPSEIALAPLATFTWAMAASSLGLVALMAAAMFLVARRTVSPLAELAAAAHTIGTGNFRLRLPPAGADEIGELAAEFNRMAEALAAKDVEVRARAAELEASNRELEAFGYSVSHDLRTPLRAMDGFSAALLEDYGERLDAEGRDALQRVRAASQRMGQLIDDLLKLSRIGRAELAWADVDLSALAHERADALQKRDRGRRVRWQIAEGMSAHGDRALLGIALDNLLENAWKFTGRTEGPEIRIGMAEHAHGRADRDGRTAFFVADNGAGFDMAHAGLLFRPFQRLHHQDEFPGTGIGLAIVSRIVRRHGGDVWVQAAPGRGASFFLTLGREASHA